MSQDLMKTAMKHATILPAVLALGADSARAIGIITDSLLWNTKQHSSLERWECELITAFVSKLNNCTFCCLGHTALGATHLEVDFQRFQSMVSERQSADIGDEMKQILDFIQKLKEGHSLDDVRQEAKEKEVDEKKLVHAIEIMELFNYENAMVNRHQTTEPLKTPDFYMGFARKLISEGGYTPLIEGVIAYVKASSA